MKQRFLIIHLFILAGFWAFHLHTETVHQKELNDALVHEYSVRDSLLTYLDEMATALDLFTDSQPIVFTAYNALVGQTDDTPTITASNKEIFPGVLALSRELLKPYGQGGKIHYGDKVWVVLPMQVEDTMNKRWTSRGDVFMMDYQQALEFGRRSGRLYVSQDDIQFASALDLNDALQSELN